MLPFSPKTSRIWQKAAFSLIYSSLLGTVLRSLATFSLFLLTLLLLNIENSTVPYLTGSLLIFVLMFEIFYRFKILRTKAENLDISVKTNLANLVSLSLAKRMLSWPFWGTTANFLKILSSDPKIAFVFRRSFLTLQELSAIKTADEKMDVNDLMSLSASYAEKEGQACIDELSFLQALFAKSVFLQKLYFQRELRDSDLSNIIHWARNWLSEREVAFWERPPSSFGLGLATIWSGGWTLETEKYTKELSLVIGQKENFLVGREKEVRQLQEVLLRTEKRNAILLGEPGIGKETIVYSLAKKSSSGQLPEGLSYKRFLELDIAAFSGGGSVEERLKNILTEVSHAQDVVLYIPQIENLAGALEGGKFDISGLLLDYLKSSLQVIGTSTRQSYHEFIESRSEFASDFEIIDVSETSPDQTVRILEEAALVMERKNKVTITYNAIKKTLELSERYLIDKVLPGKALELLDEAAVAVALKKKKIVEATDVESLVSDKAHVPAGLATEDEKGKLANLEKILHQRIVGQDEAVKSVSQAVRRARTLKKDSQKPIGVFLFLGPTGVGKTETAKALSQVYFGSEETIIRLDMSEFNQESSVYRLIGAPPGSSEYKEGGQLTEKVRANPFSLILLDEMEKAHQKVQETFLAIFDEGVTTDSSGRKVSFTNTIIIGTSNAGAEYIREEIKKGTKIESLKQTLIEKLLSEGVFKPEFLNRFDDVIVYQPLDPKQVSQVVTLMLTGLTKRLEKQDLKLSISPEVVAFLSQKGYDPTFGARPLQRLIQKEIEDRISQGLLSGQLSRGSTATFTLNNNQIQLNP
ncbi:MAG TPA: ATP-dependent Clp protease ATP-binding subunit [Candidatus Nanoarchaeia archaeon]|nr:ATP-dependent Clp protease ATP-binding subunit ClpX [uncultured archaeon]